MSGEFGEENFIASAVHTSEEVFDACGEGSIGFINTKEDIISLWCHTAMPEVVGKGWNGKWCALCLLEMLSVI